MGAFVNSVVLPNVLEESPLQLTNEKVSCRWNKAHGSNASWEWIESIAPCVEVLRQLSKSFNDILGADQGMRHAPADLADDIHTFMESLNENNVYRIQKGRVLDDDEE